MLLTIAALLPVILPIFQAIGIGFSAFTLGICTFAIIESIRDRRRAKKARIERLYSDVEKLTNVVPNTISFFGERNLDFTRSTSQELMKKLDRMHKGISNLHRQEEKGGK